MKPKTDDTPPPVEEDDVKKPLVCNGCGAALTKAEAKQHCTVCHNALIPEPGATRRCLNCGRVAQ